MFRMLPTKHLFLLTSREKSQNLMLSQNSPNLIPNGFVFEESSGSLLSLAAGLIPTWADLFYDFQDVKNTNTNANTNMNTTQIQIQQFDSDLG